MYILEPWHGLATSILTSRNKWKLGLELPLFNLVRAEYEEQDHGRAQARRTVG